MEEESMDKISQMMQMIQMMQMFEEAQKNSEQQDIEGENKKEEIRVQNFLDDKIETTEIRMLKSAIPFLQQEHQRNFAIFIKMMEMKKVLEYYNNAEPRISSVETESDWRKGMLTAMRPHLQAERQAMLDTMLRFMNLKEMLSIMSYAKGDIENEY